MLMSMSFLTRLDTTKAGGQGATADIEELSCITKREVIRLVRTETRSTNSQNGCTHPFFGIVMDYLFLLLFVSTCLIPQETRMCSLSFFLFNYIHIIHSYGRLMNIPWTCSRVSTPLVFSTTDYLVSHSLGLCFIALHRLCTIFIGYRIPHRLRTGA